MLRDENIAKKVSEVAKNIKKLQPKTKAKGSEAEKEKVRSELKNVIERYQSFTK